MSSRHTAVRVLSGLGLRSSARASFGDALLNASANLT
jgi:hypothetical protein